MLSALAVHMNSNDAASVADALVKALENPQKANSMQSRFGDQRLWALGNSLSVFAARMNPNDAAKVVARGASVVLKALENPKETSSKRQLCLADRSRLSSRA